MSALGQKQTYAAQHVMSALLPIATAKADICASSCRFTPESGHVRCSYGCPLWATVLISQLPIRKGQFSVKLFELSKKL
jgi:hypothetical protein